MNTRGELHLEKLNEDELVSLLLSEEGWVRSRFQLVAGSLSSAVRLAASCFMNGGRIIYCGAGTSGRLCAADAAELAVTYGVDRSRVVVLMAGGTQALIDAAPEAEDHETSVDRLVEIGLNERDVVVGVSASGTSRFVSAAIRHAKKNGVYSIAFTFSDAPRFRDLATVEVNLPVGSEVVIGSSRLKAGSATKSLLNCFSTALMCRCGFVYARDMVAMKAGNAKLQKRSIDIIVRACGIDTGTATRFLEASQGDIRVAILLNRLGCDVGQAKRLLQENHGNLSNCLRKQGGVLRVEAASLGYCVGVDAGGSKTVALVGRVGRSGSLQVLGKGLSGPGNVTTDAEGATQSILAAIEEACRRAGISDRCVDSIYVGAAGAGVSTIRDGLQRDLERYHTGTVTIANDLEPLLEVACSTDPRVVFVCGTGAMALARSVSGVYHRAGGWGWRLFSAAGGYGMVVGALTELARGRDAGSHESQAARAWLEWFRVDTFPELLRLINRSDTPVHVVSAALPVLMDLSDGGDVIARGIVRNAAVECGRLIRVVADQVRTRGISFPLIAAGGVVVSYPRFLESVLEATGLGVECAVEVVSEPAILCLKAAAIRDGAFRSD